MISYPVEIGLLMAITAAACALPGVYLVLRRMALLSDAIGHVLLFGIVVAFFITEDLKSPCLLIGATLSGLLTVALVGVLQRSGLVREDAAIGLVFPALFALGVVLASMFLRNTHLDVDAVLLGIPEVAPRRRFIVGNYDWGSYARVLMTGVFTLNLLFILAFYKELKLGTFDPALAAALGFLPGVLHYALMGFVSLTAVTAFDAVGPVLVVAFMVVPAATAYLLTDRLSVMLVLSVLIGAIGAVAGVYLAFEFRTTIAGMAATAFGVLFALALFLAPRRGLVARWLRRWRQHREFFETMLVIHLLQHERTAEEEEESRVDHLHLHLRWKPGEVRHVVRRAESNGWVEEQSGRLVLKEPGRTAAKAALGTA